MPAGTPGLLPSAWKSQQESRTVTKPAARLAQPPGQQHLFAEQVRHARLVDELVVVLAALVVVVHVEEVAGVVLRHRLRVFLRQIERIGDALEEDVVGLLLEAIESLQLARSGPAGA